MTNAILRHFRAWRQRFLSGSSLGVEAIGEFQTLTNSYSAQFGGNGAVINAEDRR
jgi:hypothetical protein